VPRDWGISLFYRGFVISRFLYITLSITWLKNNVVIPRTLLYRGLLNRGSTVIQIEPSKHELLTPSQHLSGLELGHATGPNPALILKGYRGEFVFSISLLLHYVFFVYFNFIKTSEKSTTKSTKLEVKFGVIKVIK